MNKKIFLLFFILILFFVNCPEQQPVTDTTTTTEVWDRPLPTNYSINHNVWDNAIVYFVITDRFYNGDTANDTSYGREHVTDTAGHFYGGDLKGLTQKINEGYFNDLSIDAIWITSPLEQIHGWVPGGYSGSNPTFKHYAYHGYYHLDWTKLDANMGTESDLQEFVDTAHSKGIRVIFDVVMNHPGYSNIKDLSEQIPNVLKTGWDSAGLSNYYNYIDFEHADWLNWWGAKWVRGGLGPQPRDGQDGRYYDYTGSDDLLKSVGYLPDFYTESTREVGLPKILQNKSDTNAKYKEGYKVRDYLISWLTEWVRKYGIDGFRCDTAKHVEKAAWYKLKVGATYALREWKSKNPSKKIDDSDFWMTGEVWGHGVTKDDYFTIGGFNSLINFTLQTSINSALTNIEAIETSYSSYASSINSDPSFNVLSYISSHDTKLFFSDYAFLNADKQKLAGTLLLLCPGAVQIYYGDECGRKNGTYSVGSDTQQKTRSKMVFNDDSDFNADILAHWQKLTQFRKKHVAIGAGSHSRIGSGTPYTFKRTKDTDKVVCVIGATGGSDIVVDVSGIWNDGTVLRDFYTGSTATVASGKVTFTADSSGVILIEENN